MWRRPGHGFSANNRRQESFVAIKAEQNLLNAGENTVGKNHCGVTSLKTKINILIVPCKSLTRREEPCPRPCLAAK